MSDLADILGGIAENAKRAACLSDIDYQDREGYWCCGKCHTRKQCDISIPELHIHNWMVFCQCDCMSEAYHRERKKLMETERRSSLKDENLSDMDTRSARAMTLAVDDGSVPFMSKLARKYVENWQTMLQSGKGGLILWGNPGTGKTYFATAIGNELQKRGALVARITPVKLLELAQGLYDSERTNVIQRLNVNDLLILDDLGAERDTSYAKEIIFGLIEDRCKKKKPIFVTTNLTIDQLKDPRTRNGESDTAYRRIFDRLLGMCTPIQLYGESHRVREGEQAKDLIRGIW